MTTGRIGRLAMAAVPPALALALVAAACSSSSKSKTSGTTAPGATTTTNGLRPGPGGGPDTTAPASTTTTTTAAQSRPKVLVAITTAGVLETLDPATGRPLRTLATGAGGAAGSTGDEIGLTPDGATVFYETGVGCAHQINRVATAGGAHTAITSGGYPTVSPDGTLLAFARQPNFTATSTACQGVDTSATAFSVVIRNLASGVETSYPLPPEVISSGLPLPIDHLSWAPDNRRLAVSIGGGQDFEQWSLGIVDRAVDKYYAPVNARPVPVVGTARSYYREAVFLPSGDLFVDKDCCSGYPPHVVSSALATVDPATGATRQQIAVGVAARDHTSLDADGTGQWLLYLSGPDLLVSQAGAKPTTLATGFQAASW